MTSRSSLMGMHQRGSQDARPRIVIAGGGFAALEAVLALRALTGDGVRLSLVSPDPTLRYRASASVEAFGDGIARTYDWRAIADDLEVGYHHSRLEAVASRQKWVRLASGARLQYDALILGLGARPRAAVAGALTFRDQRDAPQFRGFVEELERGEIRRAVFAVPSGCFWPLPLYELALLSAGRARQRDIDTEVTIVTPEQRPLELFGVEASRLVEELLAERGVRFIRGSAPLSTLRDGSLALAFDAPVRADRVVAVPQLYGQRITGLPTSWWGFVPTDTLGRVHGLDAVYAAGDMTTFPVKHGGVAAQQAERIAQVIAGANGHPVRQVRPGYLLRVRLLGGQQPLVLRTELDTFGQAARTAIDVGDRDGSNPSTKVFGHYLTPYLERRPLAA